jgi:hypothetical protein
VTFLEALTFAKKFNLAGVFEISAKTSANVMGGQEDINDIFNIMVINIFD